jgi:chaperonin GroES
VETFHQLASKLETVIFPDYESTKEVFDNKDYFLFRDGYILGKYID